MSPADKSWYSKTLLLAAVGSVLSFISPHLYQLVFTLGSFMSAPRGLSLWFLAQVCLGPLVYAVYAAFLVVLYAEGRGWASVANRRRVALLGVAAAGMVVLVGSWFAVQVVNGLVSIRDMPSVPYVPPAFTSLVAPTLHSLAWMGLLVMFASYAEPLGLRVTRWLAAALAVLTTFQLVLASQRFLVVVSSRESSLPIARPAFVGPLPTLPPAVRMGIQVFASLSFLAFCIAVCSIGPSEPKKSSEV